MEENNLKQVTDYKATRGPIFQLKLERFSDEAENQDRSEWGNLLEIYACLFQ